MKHDVNFFLLAVLLVLVVGMTGLVMYYHISITQIQTDYNYALSNLENLSSVVNQTHQELLIQQQNLAEKEAVILKFKNDLSLFKKRETSISDILLEEKGKAESLSSTLNSSIEERDRYRNLYNKYYTEGEQCKLEYTDVSAKLRTTEAKVINIRGEYEMMSLKLAEVTSAMSSAENEMDLIKNRADFIQNNAVDPEVVNKASAIWENADNAKKYLNGVLNDEAGAIKKILDGFLGK